MKNINIKILGLGYNEKLKIYIYNRKKLINYIETCSNSFNICLCENEIYLIKICSKYRNYSKKIYVGSNNYYVIVLPNLIINNRLNNRNITFILSDRNYFGLPIKNGEMILWQKQ